MKTFNKFIMLISLTALLFGCSDGGDNLETKTTKLADLRSQARKIEHDIKQLESEIVKLDPEYDKNSNNIILVSTASIEPTEFEHKIEIRGTVESRNNVVVSTEFGGRIETISIREGQNVSKGQVLMTIDAEVTRNTIAEIETSLELAQIIFERQSKLWEQKIGTEIQFLEARNRKESLERSLATSKSRLALSVVRAPFAGSIDEIPVRIGEMATPGMPLLRIVNPNDMYIQADISEIHIGRFKEGQHVDIHFPSQNKNLVSKITAVSQVINRENRTFSMEIELRAVDFTIKPNQVTILKLTDYMNDEAIVVPTRLIQRDDEGTFVFGIDGNSSNPSASKIHVITGFSYNSQTEITDGLVDGDLIVNEGFRDVSQGVEVQIATVSTAN
ncbi:MAG: efflux RND transporter periplasmic adaptor subunit [Bacteroidetes bacterium]|nr:efflux RND transporter periplasmic adaptor subunit [Bacteroidota bacterium]MDA1121593.1 efflux RND transporter periplasmic adaptor subunit [Bacteroidota bacterium]